MAMLLGSKALSKLEKFKAAVFGSDGEEELSSFDLEDAAILIPFLGGSICLYGMFSFAVLLTVASIGIILNASKFSSSFGRNVHIGLAAAWTLWWLVEISIQGTQTTKAQVSTIMVMIIVLHLKASGRLFLVISSLLGFIATIASIQMLVSSIWLLAFSESVAPGKQSSLELNHSFFMTIAISYFIYETDAITKRWSSTKLTAKAEVQNAHTVKDQLTLEKKGAVASAVNRLFVKAFGNYDVFSREVARLVKEVKADLPKESLDLLNSKEVHFSAFELERKLASGGFCTVFRGKWKAGNRQCAVKSFSSADRLDGAGLRGLVNEVVVLTTLNHKHIIKVLGYCWAPQVCLVMEYMAKGTLHDMLAFKSLEISWDAPLLSLAIQISDAIAYLHTKNPPIIHRDIKARNILMKDFRTCKLADFGLMVEEGSHQARAGTLRYVAPEVVNRADQSQQNTTRADMWSFGVCLWEMATRAQFSGLPPSYTLFSHIPRTLFGSKLPYPIPNAVYDVIEACLQPDPEQRTICAKDVYTDLKAALGTLDNPLSFFNDDDLPKLPRDGNGPYPPEDLSVDASMSWRAGTMWRQQNRMGDFNNQENSLLDTSRTIDEFAPAKIKLINQRLLKAEKRNSRQLMALNEELELPPLPHEPNELPVHSRLQVLSRLASADKATRIEFETKIRTHSLPVLPEGEVSRLLEEEYIVEEPQQEGLLSVQPRFSANAVDNGAVRSHDAPSRLGLLSRLAIAESRTQDEVHSKFSSPPSGMMPETVFNGSRLLETLNDDHQNMDVVTLEADGSVDMYCRLGLMARLADADAMATRDLVDKVVSHRTLDESCPLLQVNYPPVPPLEDDSDDAQTIHSDRKSSTSSFEGRFFSRLARGGGSSSGGGDGATSSSDSQLPAMESRFLSRLGKPVDHLPEEPLTTPAASQAAAAGRNESRFVSRLGSSTIDDTDKSPSLTAAYGNESTLPMDETQSQRETERESSIDQSEMRKQEACAEAEGLSALFARSRQQQQQPQQPVKDTLPFGSTNTQTSLSSSLLSRVAMAEACAQADIQEKVRRGETSVSCSLLSFPMDEREDEEEEDEEDADEEREETLQSGQGNGSTTTNPAISFLTSTPLGLLSRLANAEAGAVAELKDKVKNGRATVSSSLLSFPMDEIDEEEEEDDDDEAQQAKDVVNVNEIDKEEVDADGNQVDDEEQLAKDVVERKEIDEEEAKDQRATDVVVNGNEEDQQPTDVIIMEQIEMIGPAVLAVQSSSPSIPKDAKSPSISPKNKTSTESSPGRVEIDASSSPVVFDTQQQRTTRSMSQELPLRSSSVLSGSFVVSPTSRSTRAQTYQSPLERLVFSASSPGVSATSGPRRVASPLFSDKARQVQNLLLFSSPGESIEEDKTIQ